MLTGSRFHPVPVAEVEGAASTALSPENRASSRDAVDTIHQSIIRAFHDHRRAHSAFPCARFCW